MKKLKYKGVPELLAGRDNGDFKEEDLHIEVDNDGVYFGLKIKGNDEEYNEIDCYAEGYGDVCELYQLLFPKADVDWV